MSLHTISITTRLFRQLQELARQQGTSVTAVIEPTLIAGIAAQKSDQARSKVANEQPTEN